jgi:hypothetical protein
LNSILDEQRGTSQILSAFIPTEVDCAILCFLSTVPQTFWKTLENSSRLSFFGRIFGALDQRADQYVSKLHERREFEGIGMPSMHQYPRKRNCMKIRIILEHVVFGAERGARGHQRFFLIATAACLLALFVFSPPGPLLPQKSREIYSSHTRRTRCPTSGRQIIAHAYRHRMPKQHCM